MRYATLLIILIALGCSQGDFPTAPVEGVATYKGERLTSGVVYFSPLGASGQPIAGKSGGGAIGSDGRFKVSTYREGDGAVVGKHRVVWQSEDEHATRSGPKCPREAFAEVDIPAGGVRDLVVDLKLP